MGVAIPVTPGMASADASPMSTVDRATTVSKALGVSTVERVS